MNINSIAATIRVGAVLVIITAMSGGCYMLQSAQGHLMLMAKRQPIDKVIAQPMTPPALRAQLEAVKAIRDFATQELGLPDNGSYRSYADLARPYAVWNVVAAPEFSVDPKEWCYPIVGCVAYRGYFVEAKARRFAAQQRTRGLDVVVAGVAAYSTLGRFDDPVLNTMVGWNDIELASIIFHELTHQFLYVPNDAAFNEALATTVEEEGIRRWLQQQGRAKDLAEHATLQGHHQEVIQLLQTARSKLRAVYASAVSADVMRANKRAVFDDLRTSYAVLKAGWGGHAPFDAWFDHEINNAYLASIATYYTCVPGFTRELEAVDGDLKAFYSRARELAKLDKIRRDEVVCGRAEVTAVFRYRSLRLPSNL